VCTASISNLYISSSLSISFTKSKTEQVAAVEQTGSQIKLRISTAGKSAHA